MSYIFRGLTYKLIQSELACDDFYSACSFGISQACELIEEDCYQRLDQCLMRRNLAQVFMVVVMIT